MTDNEKCGCIHKCCQEIYAKRLEKGYKKMGGISLIIYDEKNRFLLGYEEKLDGYSICSGKMEEIDNYCYVKCAIRELNEEYKIKINENDFFEIFQNYIKSFDNAIFIGKAAKINVKGLNKKIEKAHNNEKISIHERGIRDIRFFYINQIKKNNKQNIKFGNYCLKIFNYLKLYIN